MKKIINGKRYDTETAKLVGSYDNGCYLNDFNFFEEELYRKTTGEFFLYGRGGANSRYAESCGDNWWSGGQRIIPISLESAKEWAEKHLSGDKYEEIFGVVEEPENNEETVPLLTYIPASVRVMIDRRKEETQEKISDIVTDALKFYLGNGKNS